jgi:hypothetical protein
MSESSEPPPASSGSRFTVPFNEGAIKFADVEGVERLHVELQTDRRDYLLLPFFAENWLAPPGGGAPAYALTGETPSSSTSDPSPRRATVLPFKAPAPGSKEAGHAHETAWPRNIVRSLSRRAPFEPFLIALNKLRKKPLPEPASI